MHGSIAPLPAAISSFGAAVTGDSLYVYGGHIGRAHQHSKDNVFDAFCRMDLSRAGGEWEVLETGPLLQGLALVSYEDRIYRIGGMSPRNAADEEADLLSLPDVACYLPKEGRWEASTPLPEGRSSHDAVVVGDSLYVVGGWNLGEESDSADSPWLESGLVADLREDPIVWRTLPRPPFQRRALAVAAAGGKLLVLGGISKDGGISQRLDSFDLETQSWSQGPDFPVPSENQGGMMGFGMSAFGVGDRVFASGAEGVIYEISSSAAEWKKGEGRLETPRFFHRLLPHRDRLLLIAGASPESGHLADIEVWEMRPGSTMP